MLSIKHPILTFNEDEVGDPFFRLCGVGFGLEYDTDSNGLTTFPE